MKKTILIAAVLCTAMQSRAQLWDLVDEIGAEVEQVPYIFEGSIEYIKVIACDESGNQLPYSSAIWDEEIGRPVWGNGKPGRGFSLARIWPCKIYKGDITANQPIDVLTRSYALDNVIFHVDAMGDTSVKFAYIPATHEEVFKIFLPGGDFPRRKLFIADRIDPVNETEYAGKEYLSNFNSLYEVDFNVPVEIPKGDGSTERINAYAALYPFVFTSEDSLQLFLTYVGLDPNPTDYCEPQAIGSPEKDVSVFPNPSRAGQVVSVKVKSESTITLTNSLGQILFTWHSDQSTVPSNLQNGVYILQVESEGTITRKKIVIQ